MSLKITGILAVGLVLAGAAATANEHSLHNHLWTNAAKESICTALGRQSSRVWFTTGSGIINEVYFPRIDRAQIGDSQLLFGNVPGERFLEEKRDFQHETTHPNGVPRPIIHSVFRNNSTKIEFTKEVVTDPGRAALRIRYHFTSLPQGVRLYVLHKPTAENDGAYDRGRVLNTSTGPVLVAWDDQVEHSAYQALTSTSPIVHASIGVVAETDGWQDLDRYGKMVHEINSNGPANLALTAEIKAQVDFEIVVGFGFSADEAAFSANASLEQSFEDVRHQYMRSWDDYLNSLAQTPWLHALPRTVQDDTLWSAATIKAHEDKLNPGAIVASLSIPNLPEGEGAPDGKDTGGYHLVWTRDLFKAALALIRLGDTRTGSDALFFMSKMERDGRMAQNAWVDGVPFWHGEQMDEEAYPILLAHELRHAGVSVDPSLQGFLDRRVARLEESSGYTQQERWEEASGFSPNTLAVMAAAFRSFGDDAAAERMLKTALDKTVSYKGPLSRLPYFVRISNHGQPDSGDTLQIANGGPTMPENALIDGGFLEWTRWFPIPSRVFGEDGRRLEQVILNSLEVYDNPSNGIADKIDHISVYRRYNEDNYGVNHRGGFWPILTAERALPDLARASSPERVREIALDYFQDTRKLWGQGDLCPEQVVPRFGSLVSMPYAASPLVWCHAEMMELAYRAGTGH